MAAVVVDSDIVSFQFKRDSRAALYRPHVAGKQWFLSFQTLAELDAWALQRRWGTARRTKLEHHLRKFAIIYADRLCAAGGRRPQTGHGGTAGLSMRPMPG
jgi:tRNA(fMet)-specific endonuclease VapC